MPVHTLADAIAFNNAHAAQELQYFGQEHVRARRVGPLHRRRSTRTPWSTATGWRGAEGIDAALASTTLDALVAPDAAARPGPTDLINGDHFGGASTYSGGGGRLPASSTSRWASSPALPVGLSFIGTAWSEPTLIKFAYAFEQATKLRRRRPTCRPCRSPTASPTYATAGAAATPPPVPARLEALMERLYVSPRFRTILRNL